LANYGDMGRGGSPPAGGGFRYGPERSRFYAGAAVAIGNGSAHTVVRTDAKGALRSIGVVFTAGMLEGLPKAGAGENPDFPYLLPMPTTGPKTIIDHMVIDWESEGHPPPKVYDVQHFDFHFYLMSYADQLQVTFNSPLDSADPAQQPAPEFVPAGYVLPPGTAVPQMGVHAINPAAAEFQQQPFTATFIYGYYNQQLTLYRADDVAGIPAIQAVLFGPRAAARCLRQARRLSLHLQRQLRHSQHAV